MTRDHASQWESSALPILTIDRESNTKPMTKSFSARRDRVAAAQPVSKGCRLNVPRSRERQIARSGFLFLFILLLVAPISATAQSVEQDDTVRVESLVPDAASTRATEQEMTVELETAEKLIVQQTNEFRQSQGLAALARDEDLAAAAEKFASYMARTDRYGHNADGQRPGQRARAAGYEVCIVAENIAYRFDSTGFETDPLATRFVTGWKESPGHRENMLRDHVTQTGVAVARGSDSGVYYAVQLFGRPRSAAIEFEIDNDSEQIARYSIGRKRFTLPPRYRRTHRQCVPKEIQLLQPSASSDPDQASDNESETADERGEGKTATVDSETSAAGAASQETGSAESAGTTESPQWKTVQTFVPTDGANYRFVIHPDGNPALIQSQTDQGTDDTADARFRGD